MKRNVILDNEEALVMKGDIGDYLVANKRIGEWSIIFDEESSEEWFDILLPFSKETNEKILKSGISKFFDNKENELLLKALKKEFRVNYIAEIFRDNEILATTSSFGTYKELAETLNTLFKEDLEINIYRTIYEPLGNGCIKQHHKLISEF